EEGLVIVLCLPVRTDDVAGLDDPVGDDLGRVVLLTVFLPTAGPQSTKHLDEITLMAGFESVGYAFPRCNAVKLFCLSRRCCAHRGHCYLPTCAGEARNGVLYQQARNANLVFVVLVCYSGHVYWLPSIPGHLRRAVIRPSAGGPCYWAA